MRLSVRGISDLVDILIVSISWLSRSSIVVVCWCGVPGLLATSARPLVPPGPELGHGGAHQGEG